LKIPISCLRDVVANCSGADINFIRREIEEADGYAPIHVAVQHGDGEEEGSMRVVYNSSLTVLSIIKKQPSGL